MGLEKFSGYDDEYENTVVVDYELVKTYLILPENEQLTVLKGYDYLINASSPQDSLKLNIGSDRFIAVQNFQTHQHLLKINRSEFDFDVALTLKHLLDPKFNLPQYLQSATASQSERYNIPPSNLSIVKTIGGFTVNFQISNLSFTKTGKEEIKIQYVQGDYLIKKNN